jgi:PPOX class probable F420-dependent enzyme
VPAAPLPPELDAFLARPNAAVVATVGSDGAPLSAATWYDWREGRIVLCMDPGGPRARSLRHEPRFSLTVLAGDWYHQLTVYGRVVELRDDPELDDLDAMSRRYRGTPYDSAYGSSTTAIAVVERWSTWGDPGSVA